MQRPISIARVVLILATSSPPSAITTRIAQCKAGCAESLAVTQLKVYPTRLLSWVRRLQTIGLQSSLVQ